MEIDDENTKTCRVSVPDLQLSLAIGNKGQNARLAAKLTGWKIDVKAESDYQTAGDYHDLRQRQPALHRGQSAETGRC